MRARLLPEITALVAALVCVATPVLAAGMPAPVEVLGYHEGIEGSNVENIARVGENHYAMSMLIESPTPDYPWPNHTLYWFMFRVDGAAGRTLTFDVTNTEWEPTYWRDYHPVMTYSDPLLPGGEAAWQVLDNASRFGTTFRFTVTIEQDHAWIALHYPYLPSYEERYMATLGMDPRATAEVVGITAQGRPIYVLTITDPETPDLGKKGVWIFAKGHAIEHTPSWSVLGAAEFLLGADPVAASLRQHTIFKLIPMIAPDATAEGRSFNPTTGYSIELRFLPGIYGAMTEETIAIWQHAQDFVDAGQTIDACINLHAPHGSTEPLYGGWYYDPDSNQNESESEELAHDIMYNNLPYTGNRWLGWADVREPYYAPRLNSRCYAEFGSIALIFEICMQDPSRRLTIAQLKEIGEGFARGVHDYYDGFGPPAMPVIDNRNINYESSPGWTTARYAPGYYGVDYQFAYGWQPGEPVEWATWTAHLDSAGAYAVHAWWVSDPNAATDAVYEVIHAGGTAQVVVNMEENGGQWNLLGTFGFEAGDAGRVRLSNVANDAVGADAIWFQAIESSSVASDAADASVQLASGLEPVCFPNPFRHETTVQYRLSGLSSVGLTVFDSSGRRLLALSSGPRPAGEHEIRWNGNDGQGIPVASGVYFIRLRAGDTTRTLRIVRAD